MMFEVPSTFNDESLATIQKGVLQTQYRVIRRNGQLTSFDAEKIKLAITKAFLAVEKDAMNFEYTVDELTNEVVNAVKRRAKETHTIHIEDIQDQVELALMRAEKHKVARAYVIYREQHAKQRIEQQKEKPVLHVTDKQGNLHPLNEQTLYNLTHEACDNLSGVSADVVIKESVRNLFDGISENEVHNVLIMSARSLIEKEPNYSYVAARLLLSQLRIEAFDILVVLDHDDSSYFTRYIQYGVQHGLIDPQLAEFDLNLLGQALKNERDLQLNYLGLQTLYDRYLLQINGDRFELPQALFMRVAMGLAINETEKEKRAIEFYNLLSLFDFMCSTPTLFNSGTLRPQLSSCFVSTIEDSAAGIMSAISDNAQLSKYAGGIGNDWSKVRGMGSHIKGTNGKSSGVVPFMKIANDGLVAFNQSGKRRGSGCAYLETWHIDIEEFLELRKNTGDDRRRTHDMNTANWVPDLFMQRVMENGQWTLFSPNETPDLHECYGLAFKDAYLRYESLINEGKIKLYKRISAVDLWRKMLTMLYETGHPWIVFKDACNIRSPQQHVGVVHSSNLCTEITLNTSQEEVAVCNLGSINLANHINEQQQIDYVKLEKTINTAMRMLDNVIDINYYSIPQARVANLRHRPIGLGIMGFQDALYRLRIPYASQECIDFSDKIMENISYYAIKASSNLAKERGAYSSFEGSLWQQGILPIDSIEKLIAQRINHIEISQESSLDWYGLREQVKVSGMRNSNCMAIAPTATISSICGVTQSIEPTYQNLFVKSNLSGEFTVVNSYLVEDLKKLSLWNESMINELKFYNGSLTLIDRIPNKLKQLYATAFEIEPQWLIESASRRQKWIDQSQSLNLYMSQPSGRKMDNLYKLAWIKGLKSTYYLRTTSASQVEKLTVQTPNTCLIDDPDCEACQ